MFKKALIITILAATTVGCATSPHGRLYMALEAAPNLETGEGCERFGVWRTPGVTKVSNRPFNAHFVSTWEIDDHCPSDGRNAVWGCYNEDTGDAYIVGRDARVYWHEWCHAKVGRGHLPAGSTGPTIAP